MSKKNDRFVRVILDIVNKAEERACARAMERDAAKQEVKPDVLAVAVDGAGSVLALKSDASITCYTKDLMITGPRYLDFIGNREEYLAALRCFPGKRELNEN